MSRAARARAVLLAAEQQYGIASLTLVKNQVPQAEPTPTLAPNHRQAFAVPAALNSVLPQGLLRGTVCCVEGSTMVLLALAAQVTQQDGWAAFVALADLNFVAAQDLGMQLERVAVVPDVGDKAAEIMATLIDGMDLVVVGRKIGLTDRQQSRLSARARERGTTLLVAGPWPHARVHLYGRPGTWQGANRGLGRLTSCQYQVQQGTKAHGMTKVTVQLRSDGLHTSPRHTLHEPAPLRLLA